MPEGTLDVKPRMFASGLCATPAIHVREVEHAQEKVL